MVICFLVAVILVVAANRAAWAEAGMKNRFADPPASCRPHTRWWWMGNALSKEDISWQLEQMHAQGIGGVEQITMQPVYDKGNCDFLSDEYFDLVTHAIREAKRLDMEFSLNFGGPGWVIGGDWVPQEDRSQNIVPAALHIAGGRRFSGALPTGVGDAPHTGQMPARDIAAGDRLVAVVAGKMVDDRLEESSLIDLTARVKDRHLEWDVPDGDWQLMAFWLVYTGQGNALDHFNRDAMVRYCNYLGGRFREAFGDEFGKTVESFFCDSFEVALIDNGIYWSDGLLARFEAFKGYDLTPYLPAIWWEVSEISPKIRYDVNEYLHHAGLEAFFKPFLAWCEANGVQGRIQPYGFPTDILEGAGLTHLPEMEITAGEKDAVPWFDTRIGPKKYVASGAHLYGRNVVTVEAYTYLHWEPYRATLEELKIASDVFLRSGANKFYNHGYTGTPERDIAPSRRFFAEILISHSNVWWQHYHALSGYIARCCYLLRQGHFVADVAVYSPLANQWTLDVRNARRWTRDFDWGGLGRALLANGYDFDLVNDDVLLNRAAVNEGVLRVRDLEYRVLLLPDIHAMPLETLERVRDFVADGGVAIALEGAPERSVGWAEHERNDQAVRTLSEALFDTPAWRRNTTAPRAYGEGMTYHIENVIDTSDILEQTRSALNPFLNVLRRHVTPDFGIDFVRENLWNNDGLAFVHRRDADRDLYFVTNIQESPVDMRVAFRVAGRNPVEWNPCTGEIAPLWEYEVREATTLVRLRLAPYESTFIVFEEGAPQLHATDGTFDRVLRVDGGAVEALADSNGLHMALLSDGTIARVEVDDLPAPYRIEGSWNLVLESPTFPRVERTLDRLVSWTGDAATRHFSGTGRYTIDFHLPAAYTKPGLRLKMHLGEVGAIAKATLNGRDVGLRWMRGQGLDITHAARSGGNTLVVEVTNTLINRVAGLDELPPVPEHLRPRYGDDPGAASSPAHRLLGFEPLPNSGLLGPVTVHPLKHVVVPVQHQP